MNFTKNPFFVEKRLINLFQFIWSRRSTGSLIHPFIAGEQSTSYLCFTGSCLKRNWTGDFVTRFPAKGDKWRALQNGTFFSIIQRSPVKCDFFNAEKAKFDAPGSDAELLECSNRKKAISSVLNLT